MKKVFMFLLIILVICGCYNKNKVTTSFINKEYIEEIALDKEYIIIDVRTKDEYNQSHVIDSINIPHDQIDENTILDKNKIIFVYCRSGNRSNIAYKTLKDLGYTVYDLGGIENIDISKESNDER